MKKARVLVFYVFAVQSIFAQEGDPELTEVWEPVPPIVTPGLIPFSLPPSDAMVLFDGKDMDQWDKETGGAAEWLVEDGQLIAQPGKGGVKTKQKFGDIQLHIEWNAVVDEGKKSQGYSNSGIFFMGRYELQVLNSYKNLTYSNGQAGSIYKQHIPLVNASRKPGEWQAYDIVFMAPVFNTDGSLNSAARVTVFHNGVLIQNSVEIKGNTVYIGQPKYEAHETKESLMLQDHNNFVRYRNIWIREL